MQLQLGLTKLPFKLCPLLFLQFSKIPSVRTKSISPSCLCCQNCPACKYSLIWHRLFPSPVEAILRQVSVSPQTHTHCFFQAGGSVRVHVLLCVRAEIGGKQTPPPARFMLILILRSLWVYFTVQNVRLTAPPVHSPWSPNPFLNTQN